MSSQRSRVVRSFSGACGLVSQTKTSSRKCAKGVELLKISQERAQGNGEDANSGRVDLSYIRKARLCRVVLGSCGWWAASSGVGKYSGATHPYVEASWRRSLRGRYEFLGLAWHLQMLSGMSRVIICPILHTSVDSRTGGKISTSWSLGLGGPGRIYSDARILGLNLEIHAWLSTDTVLSTRPAGIRRCRHQSPNALVCPL